MRRIFPTILLVLLTSVSVVRCATINAEVAKVELDIESVPECKGLKLGDVAVADGTIIAQAARDIAADQLGALLDLFLAAKGQSTFECEYKVASMILTGQTPPANASNALYRALALQHPSVINAGALTKLQTYHANMKY